MPAVWPKPTLPPDEVAAEEIKVAPVTDGIFTDLRYGAPGVIITPEDEPSPHWIDSVLNPPGSTLVYDRTIVLPPLPYMAKMVTTTNVAVKLIWTATGSRQDLLDHKGRTYFYMDDNPSTNIRPVHLIGGDIYVRVRSSDRKVEILSGNTAKTLADARTASTVALVAARTYRFEYNVVQGTNGHIEVRIYEGHGVTPIDTLIANFNTGTTNLGVEFGNTNGANMAGHIIRMGGFASSCTDWAGPYLDPPRAFSIETPDGFPIFSMLPDGTLIYRTPIPYQITSGGTEHYLVQRGDVVFRLGPRGLSLGPNRNLGNPLTKTGIEASDMFFDFATYRAWFQSENLRRINDPVDRVLERMNQPKDALYANYQAANLGCDLIAGAATGAPNATFAATTVAGAAAQDSDTISLTDGSKFELGDGVNPRVAYIAGSAVTYKSRTGNTLQGCGAHPAYVGGEQAAVMFLTLKNRGHGILINNVSYNIAEVVGPQAVILTPAPAANASNQQWKLKTYPYPDSTSGIGAGGAIGQDKYMPHAFPYIRAGIKQIAVGGEVANSGTIAIPSTRHFNPNGTAYLNGTPVTYGSLDGTHLKGCGPHAAVQAGDIVSSNPLVNTVNNQNTITAAGFTKADIGRHILINDNPALTSSGKGCHIITNVVGSTITLDSNVLATLTQAQWRLAGSDNDQSAQPVQTPLNTVFETNCEICNFAVDMQLASGDWSLNFVPSGQLFDNAGGAVPLMRGFKAKSDGSIEVLNGLGVVNAKTHQVQGQPMFTVGTHAARLAAAHRAGVLWSESDTGIVYMDDGVNWNVWSQPGSGGGGGAGNFIIGTHVGRLAAAHVAGQQWKESDTGLIYLDDGTNWQIWKGDGAIVKTADESVTNSNGAQNDDHLKFPIEPNELWFVELQLDLTAGSVNSDVKLQWSVPAGTTYKMGRLLDSGPSASGNTSALQTTNIAVASLNGEFSASLLCWINAGGTAGIANLMWAQNTAQAGETTTLLRGSMMRVRRLA